MNICILTFPPSESLFLPPSHRHTFLGNCLYHLSCRVMERIKRCCMTYTLRTLERAGILWQKTNEYTQSDLQKCEPLASRLRENLDSLERALPDNCYTCKGEKGRNLGKVTICHTWNPSLCIFGILFKMRKIIHSFLFFFM